MKLQGGITAFFLLAGCASQPACSKMPEDIAPNPAKLGNYQAEFETRDLTGSKHSIGTSEMFLYQNSSLEGLYIDFFGVYQGTLTLVSDQCPVNYSVRYKGVTRIYLKDLLGDKPRNCLIELIATTDKIKGVQYQGIENGRFETYVIPTKARPITLIRNITSSLGFKQDFNFGIYTYQKQEGQTSEVNEISLSTESAEGFYTITNSCKAPTIKGIYDSKFFTLNLKQLYGKAEVKYLQDSCAFYINITPTDSVPYDYFGKLNVVVYEKTVRPLEFARLTFSPGLMRATGASYVGMVAINNDWKANNTHLTTYKKDTTYWIRMFTQNGRKSVFSYRNGKVVWW